MRKMKKEAGAMKKREKTKAVEERSGRAFKVTITETLERVVTVYESELKEPTPADAEQTVRDWWLNSQIVLGPEDYTGVEFHAEEGGGQDGE
ncbi:MAG: DpnD/PcfM family protein [Clostridiales bacterium]|nr:DpnD/PcfM family protein [Clostridiales bacterium]